MLDRKVFDDFIVEEQENKLYDEPTQLNEPEECELSKPREIIQNSKDRYNFGFVDWRKYYGSE